MASKKGWRTRLANGVLVALGVAWASAMFGMAGAVTGHAMLGAALGLLLALTVFWCIQNMEG